MRVDFVVGGAQKAGTTTLDAYLRRHPAIGMAQDKETHFFDVEERDWPRPDYAPLHALFDPGKRIYGDATPVYLYWMPAQYRINLYNPGMKWILVFRDPIDRAYSNWRMVRRFTAAGKTAQDGGPLEPHTFSQAIRSGRRRMLDQQELPGLNRWHAYVERGFYGLQLKGLLTVFPARQILCLNFVDLVTSPETVLARVAAFLGIEPFPTFETPLVANADPEADTRAMIDPEDAAYLAGLFREDLTLFRALSGLDIGAWRVSRHLSPDTVSG